MLSDILSYLPAFTWWNALLLVAFLAACWGVASLIALRLPIPHIMGIPFIGSPEFFLSRGDFLEKGAKKYGEIFSFRLAQHKVYAVSGPETRQLFFSTPERTVSMTHGYRVLFGGVPKLEDVVEDVQKQEDATPFIRQLLRILSSDKLAPAVQDMISYTKDVCQVMGDKGEIDPFDTIFKLIFRYSCRLVACKEIVDNPALLKEVHQIYNVLDEGGKMIPVLFPNLPTPEKKRRTAATTRLYMILMEIINNRQKNNVRHEDALQVLLDEEKMQVHEVVGWVLGALFAAVINTGMTSAWTLCYLAQHPEWRDRVMKEYDAKCEEQGTGKGLQGMTLAVLESLNELELVMREVMRLTITGTTLRRIMQKDVYYKGNHLEAGAFMAYRLGNTHLNSSPYTNPEQFDPERFLPPREEHLKEDKALMIWGVGKHPCVGMRVAKIEMKLMVMMMLHNFDFEVKTGPLPMPDINNTQMSTPAKPVIVSYTRRAM